MVSCPPEVHPEGVVKLRALAKGTATARVQSNLENIMNDGEQLRNFCGGREDV